MTRNCFPEMSEWSLGCRGRGWSRPQRRYGVGRLFLSLMSIHAAASALALRGSSALECPREGSAEPSPWPECNCTVWPKQGERPAGGLLMDLPPPCTGNTLTNCILRAFSLQALGSASHRLRTNSFVQFIVRLLPLEMQRGGNKKGFKLPISANLSHKWRFCRPKSDTQETSPAAAELDCAWTHRRVELWMKSQGLKLNRRDVAQLGSLSVSLHPAFFQL